MKKWLVLFSACAVSAHGALVQFGLSPTGTDVGVGLSPSNTVPQSTNSTGSGGTLLPGSIQFETTNSTLYFALGYGSAAGFSNLTGAATSVALQGPSVAGSNAPVIADLSRFIFTGSNAALGGIVLGSLVLPTNAVSNFLAGQTYLSIGTAAYPLGELRGQLIIPTNAPPIVMCPPSTNVQCGNSAPLYAQVSSPGFGALTVISSVNSTNFTTNHLAASPLHLPYPPVQLPEGLSMGSNTVTITAIDRLTNIVTCTTTVTVTDMNPPTITRLEVDPKKIPHENKMFNVTLRARATDNCGSATWRIVSVTSSDGGGSFQITGAHTVLLSGEKQKGKGYEKETRTYTITVVATDQAGNESEPETITVSADH